VPRRRIRLRALRRCLRRSTRGTARPARGRAGDPRWLALRPAARPSDRIVLRHVLNKSDGQPKQLGNILKRDPAYGDHIAR
jgi:hypothetical protein